MAHKTLASAIKAIKDDKRGIVIVWRKDWERWPEELLAATLEDPSFTRCDPFWLTKNQVVIAIDRSKATQDSGGFKAIT